MPEFEIFREGPLAIKAKRIILTTSIGDRVYWLLRPGWWLCESGEFNERIFNHPLAKELIAVKSLKAFSLTPDSLLLEKVENYDWQPIVSKIIHLLFSFEKLRRRVAHIIGYQPKPV